MVSLFQLPKMLRVIKLIKFVHNTQSITWRMLNLLIIYIVMAHIFACVFILIGRLQPQDEETWLTANGLLENTSRATTYSTCAWLRLQEAANVLQVDVLVARHNGDGGLRGHHTHYPA